MRLEDDRTKDIVLLFLGQFMITFGTAMIVIYVLWKIDMEPRLAEWAYVAPWYYLLIGLVPFIVGVCLELLVYIPQRRFKK